MAALKTSTSYREEPLAQKPSKAQPLLARYPSSQLGMICTFALMAAVFLLDALVFSRRDASSGSLLQDSWDFLSGAHDHQFSFPDVALVAALLAFLVNRQRDRSRPKAVAKRIELPEQQHAGHARSLSRAREHCDKGEAASERQGALAKLNQALEQTVRQDGGAASAEQASKLLLDFERQGGKGDAVSYNLLIRAFAKRGDIAAAKQWLQRMRLSGIEASVCSYNTLLDASAKGKDAAACDAILYKMLKDGPKPNVVSYATAIYAHSRLGHEDKAESWFRQMLDAGIEPDAVSYNSLIHACGVRGNARAAERWLEDMRSRGIEATVTTYTATIDACAKAGDVSRAEHWMEQMIACGVEPNVVSYSSLVDACVKASDLRRAERWHDLMLEQKISPNAHTYSSLISACAKSGDIDAAERWLDRAADAGIAPDAVMYSGVINACGKANDADRAMAIFTRMQASGVKAHIVAYAALARPFAYRGDWTEVERIAGIMASERVRPNEFFLYAQLLAYANAQPKMPQRAERCFRDAVRMGIQANDRITGVLARVLGRGRCNELVKELCGR
eukprot:TRINITY_DN101219_c0_g1_i1.p1 TRINITY_DN101219_c0_g1~~TRINITY_DN101219_c0_g1_i1.p1  ORF type:complete len:613 (-),score=137.69 TRINITY_DN101219_c0_g1_i1:134-1822(-)